MTEERRRHDWKDNIRTFIGLPAAFLAMAAVVGKGCGFIGVDPPVGPGQKFQSHVATSAAVHKAVDSIIKLHESRDSAQDIDLKGMRELQEGQAIGECLENPCSFLARQKGMLKFCSAQGIERCRIYWRDST